MADHSRAIQELTAENDVLKKRIHELEAMEMALQASETRFKSIVATSQEWIWTIDTQGVHTYSNPTIEKILGFTPDEIVRQGAAQYIILAEDIPKMMEILARSIEQKKGWSNSVLRWKHKDGTYRYLESNAVPIYDNAGVLQGFQGSDRDITQRIYAKQSLRESENQYKFLTENMNDILWIMDMNLKTVYVTPSIEAVLGFTREERLRQSVQEQLTPGSLSVAWETLAREQTLEKKGQSDPNRKATLTLEFYHKDGSTRWLETIISGIRDDQNVLINLYGLSRDITERIKTEGKLRESEARYRSVVENVDEAIMVIQDEMIKFVNARAVESFGYSMKELLSIPVFELIHPEDRNAVIERYLLKISGDTTRTRHTCRSIYKGDQTAWIEIGSILIDWEGRPATLNLITDITERKQAEEALQKSEKTYRDLSIIDGLTQLYNSRHFYAQITMEITRTDRYGQPLTLLFLDLDDFKRFNDTYGHISGDKVLFRLGQVIKRQLRQSDSAYRYGGEEFIIILPMTTTADGTIVAERIMSELKKENFSTVPDETIHMTVSIGIAQYRPGEDIKGLINRVDQCMYQAKKDGKNRFFSES